MFKVGRFDYIANQHIITPKGLSHNCAVIKNVVLRTFDGAPISLHSEPLLLYWYGQLVGQPAVPL